MQVGVTTHKSKPQEARKERSSPYYAQEICHPACSRWIGERTKEIWISQWVLHDEVKIVLLAPRQVQRLSIRGIDEYARTSRGIWIGR